MLAAADDFPTADAHAEGGFPGAAPEAAAGAVDFGWEGDGKKVTGRRRKAEAKKKAKPGSFESMGFTVEILRGIKRKGYQLPTPIQRKAMPAVLAGSDVVGMARTGSGKTAAFVLPMLQKLGKHSGRAGARAVILAPTRELALQTARFVRDLGKHTDLRTATLVGGEAMKAHFAEPPGTLDVIVAAPNLLVGGDSMEAQFAELAGNPDVIVATPGRLAHHLEEVRGFSLKTVEYAVFDEADRLFEMGFAEQLRAILAGMAEARQTLLFSATMPRALAEFARAGLKDPTLVRLDAESKISPDLGLAFFSVREEDKLAALMVLVREVVPAGRPTLIFASTRHHVELVSQLLAAEGIPATFVYGTLDQAARKINIAKFRAQRAQFMVVTDVAARGIDIPLLDNVINFDFPPQPKLFVHRVGRAARAGRSGTAYSLFTRDELPWALDLHLFLARRLAPAPRASIASAAAAADADAQPDTSLFGSFPLVALETANEHVRDVIGSSVDLQSAAKSATKAFALYRKTRPGASHESVRRARDIPGEGIHPLLAQALPSAVLGGLEAQEGLAAISSALRNYRPAQTVLQASVAGPRGAHRLAGRKRAAVAAARQDSVGMLASREPEEAAVLASDSVLPEAGGAAPLPDDDDDFAAAAAGQLSKRRRSAKAAASLALTLPEEPEASGKFKQNGFYIPHQRTDQQDEAGYSVNGPGGGGAGAGMEAAVLDIVGEDAEGIAATKGTYHWDKRHRKYVQLQPGEGLRAGKRVRAESGAATKLREGGKGKKKGDDTGALYDKWAKQQKRRVPVTGSTESRGTSFDTGLADRFKNGGRGWDNPMKKANPGAAGARQELKSAEQVAKERRVAERKKVGNKPRGGDGVSAAPKGKAGHKALAVARGDVGKPGGRGKLPKGAAPPRKFKGDNATRGGKGGKAGQGGKGGSGGRGKDKRR